ncbi:MAG: hypothetical protein WBM76_12465, partial [Woeseiaceae bacterium]
MNKNINIFDVLTVAQSFAIFSDCFLDTRLRFLVLVVALFFLAAFPEPLVFARADFGFLADFFRSSN